MKNLFVILIVAILMVGCKHKEKLNILPGMNEPQKSVVVDSVRLSRQTISYSDPAIYGGANILQYFFSLLRASDFDDAVDRLTAKSSIKKYGRQKILDFYENIRIDYRPVLLSIVRHGKDSATLRYRVWRMATSRFVDIKTLVENDSARIFLPDRLDEFIR